MFHFKQRYLMITGYLVPILLSLISTAIVAANVQTAKQDAEFLDQSRVIAENLGDLAFNTQVMSRTTRGYLLMKNPASLQAYQEANERVNTLLPVLDKLITDEVQNTNFTNFKNSVSAIVQLNQRLIDLVNNNNSAEAIRIWKEEGATKLDNDITNQLSSLRNREKEVVEEKRERQIAGLDQLVVVVLRSSVISLILAVVIGFIIISMILQKINQEANGIATAATEIATTIEEQERLAVQQASSMNETTTSMDELGVSSRQSAEQAASASAGANQILTLVSGMNLTGTDGSNSSSLKHRMAEVQSQILRLSEHLGQINNITNLVSDLANQTNMLALNASVEAVRAGEHGKGFGVVASEIRKLADQSKQSAERINDLIMDIQNAMNSTVMATEEGKKSVDFIVSAVNDVTMNIQQISLNSKHQAIAIQQVVEAMNSLNKAAQQTAGGIAETRLGTQQLNQTALNLKSMI